METGSTDRKRERDEKSYVRGAYGRQRDEQLATGRIQYLRDPKTGKPTHSVLLAVFVNEALGEYVTLAQVFWFQDNSLGKIHIVHVGTLGIEENFAFSGNLTNFKKQMKALGSEVYDEFSRYSERFRKLFGLRSDKALDLFSQIVSIKEIGGLNEFVREHMLERGDEQDQIVRLRDNFDNLNQAHELMLKAEQQLAALRPIVLDSDRLADIQRRINEAERCAFIVPFYFAWRRKDLVEQAKEQAEHDIETYLVRRAESVRRLDALRKDHVDLEVTLRNDATEQRIAQLAGQISSRTELRDLKHRPAAYGPQAKHEHA